MSEYDTEPVPGLPYNLPEGETLIWQASPDAKAVAKRVLHSNAVIGYFALLAAVPVVSALVQGGSVTASLASSARLAIVGAVAIAIMTVLSRAIARTTIYSLTNKRIVMRYGVAFPLSLNVPFGEISAIDCKTYPDGTADIALATSGALRMSYLHLWPHARPWHVESAQPTLRMLPNGADHAKSIASAMVAAGVQGAAVRAPAAANAELGHQSVPGLTSVTA